QASQQKNQRLIGEGALRSRRPWRHSWMTRRTCESRRMHGRDGRARHVAIRKRVQVETRWPARIAAWGLETTYHTRNQLDDDWAAEAGHQVVTWTGRETVISTLDVVEVCDIGAAGQSVQGGNGLRGSIERANVVESQRLIHQRDERGPLRRTCARAIDRLRAAIIAIVDP